MSQPLSSPSDSSLRSPAITILSSVPRISSIPIPPHYLTAASFSFSLLGFFLWAVVAARSLNPDWMMAKRNNESRPKCPRLRRSYRDTDRSNCLRWDIIDFGAITIICVGHGCHVLLGMFDHWFDKKLSGIYPGYYGTSAPQCNSQLGKESCTFAHRHRWKFSFLAKNGAYGGSLKAPVRDQVIIESKHTCQNMARNRAEK